MPNSIRLSPGGIIPRDMTDRQWDSYTANAKADYIKSGQTDYDTGTGYFLGDHNGTPKLSIGNSAGNKVTWDGSTLSITGSINLSNTTQTFTPTWLDFSANPTGTISYMDLGRVVVMWSTLSGLGTSDDQFMRWDAGSIPAAIRPTAARIMSCDVLTGDPIANQYTGGVIFSSDGSAIFTIGETITYSGLVTQSSNIFTSTGPKGLPAGWLVIYPK